MREGKTIKELPRSERPYEKCIEKGPAFLSDAELLAVVLKSGTKELTSIDLARKILGMNREYEGLEGIHHICYEELIKIRGIGPVKAVQILCIGEIAKRMAKSTAKEKLQFSSPESIAEYFMEEMRHAEKESVRALFFDGKHSLIREEIISVGTVNAALSSPREVYLEALRAQAVYLILLHNHPSGSPEPSRQDVILTKRMKEAGELIGIELSDHIIIGDHCYYSFRENHSVFS